MFTKIGILLQKGYFKRRGRNLFCSTLKRRDVEEWAMEDNVNLNLTRFINLLSEEKKEYIVNEVKENLNAKSQVNLAETIQKVLEDEIAFLLEVEISRQNLSGKE